MLSRLSLFARLGIISGLAAVSVAAPALRAPAAAWADDDDDEASGDDDDDGGGGKGDDDDDSAGGGGDDDDGGGGGGDDDDDDEEEVDKDQPAVTAGGLFTKKTYPITELERPLTLTGGITELRGGIDIDMSDTGAFETWNVKLDGRYGVQDNVELQFAFAQRLLTADPDPMSGLSFAAGKPQTSAEAGLEFAIAYDLVDFRTLLVVPSFGDEDKDKGIKHDFDLGVAFGFPFRYKPKEQVAVVALEKLMTIHLVPRDKAVMQPDGTFKTESSTPKPDLTIGVGIVYQALPPLALILRGELVIPEFNFKEKRRVPASLAVQFTPARNVDIGGEFTLGNVAPTDPDDTGPLMAAGPFDDRSLLLFGQFRL